MHEMKRTKFFDWNKSSSYQFIRGKKDKDYTHINVILYLYLILLPLDRLEW